MSIPEVLLSGNHAEIEKWRVARQMEKTRKVRPDLLN
jgi:tRNA (guanine37-N1)-methyltransferase